MRVVRGTVGLAWDGGTPVLLGEGLHVYNEPTFRFEKAVDKNTPHILHGATSSRARPQVVRALASVFSGGKGG